VGQKGRCRVCKTHVGKGGFQTHTLKHKRDFCQVIGRWEGDAWKINFEDVVLHYNPEEADEKKCLHYPKLGMKTQKSLVQFGKDEEWK